MQVKVCGLKTTEQVESCIKYGASFCGFILNYKKIKFLQKIYSILNIFHQKIYKKISIRNLLMKIKLI